MSDVKSDVAIAMSSMIQVHFNSHVIKGTAAHFEQGVWLSIFEYAGIPSKTIPRLFFFSSFGWQLYEILFKREDHSEYSPHSPVESDSED